MKQGCPTAYTYPYDDISSTFTCQNIQGGVSVVDYQITFCPNNESRLAEQTDSFFLEEWSNRHFVTFISFISLYFYLPT